MHDTKCVMWFLKTPSASRSMCCCHNVSAFEWTESNHKKQKNSGRDFFFWGGRWAYPAGRSTCTSSAGTRSACRLCHGRAETRTRRPRSETCGTCEAATPPATGPRCRCCDLGARREPSVSVRSCVPGPLPPQYVVTRAKFKNKKQKKLSDTWCLCDIITVVLLQQQWVINKLNNHNHHQFTHPIFPIYIAPSPQAKKQCSPAIHLYFGGSGEANQAALKSALMYLMTLSVTCANPCFTPEASAERMRNVAIKFNEKVHTRSRGSAFQSRPKKTK